MVKSVSSKIQKISDFARNYHFALFHKIRFSRDFTSCARKGSQARCTAKRDVRHNASASATWFWCTHNTDPGPQVATSILCRDVAKAGTRLVLGRDMIFMSWRGQPFGCRNMALGVITRRLLGDLKLVSRHTF